MFECSAFLNCNINLWHSLLTDKSEVGCEALSSHENIAFMCSKQNENRSSIDAMKICVYIRSDIHVCISMCTII